MKRKNAKTAEGTGHSVENMFLSHFNSTHLLDTFLANWRQSIIDK